MTRWSGPWLQALDAAGNATPLPDSAWDRGRLRLPSGTVKVIVRWREPGHKHPRKRTLPAADASSVLTLAGRIAAARVSGQGADAAADSGAAATPGPACATSPNERATGEPRSTTCSAAPAESAEGEVMPPATQPLFLPAPTAPQHRPSGLPAQRAGSTVPSAHTPTGPDPAVPAGPTVAEFTVTLLEEFGAGFEQRGDDSTPRQLELATRMYVYRAGDPLLAQYPGLRVGDSIHLSVLTVPHCGDALKHRRCINYQAVHNNEVMRQRHEKKVAAYEAKLAAYEQRTGRRGRKPSPPTPPAYLPATCSLSEGAKQPLISERTEQVFVQSAAFILNRAADRGLMPQGNVLNVWRGLSAPGKQAKPYRQPTPNPAANRMLPGLGFVIDLGDALASHGRLLSEADGRRTGERYRFLPFLASARGLRPGEGRMARPEHCDERGCVITAEPGLHLKLRKPGDTREVPVSDLDLALQRAHVSRGLTSDCGYLFSSPHGHRLDLSNFKEDFLAPAMKQVLGPSGLWAAEGAALVDVERDWYLLRKIGISIWLAHGLDTSWAARFAGHDELTQNRDYKGIIRGARQRLWSDMSTTMTTALAEHPPRGDGELAQLIRSWLASR